MEYLIKQYPLDTGALEIQYIEEYFGEFPRKKTATEIVKRLQRQKDKEQRRQETKERRAQQGPRPAGEDPDLAGITPGPQPLADWQLETDSES